MTLSLAIRRLNFPCTIKSLSMSILNFPRHRPRANPPNATVLASMLDAEQGTLTRLKHFRRTLLLFGALRTATHITLGCRCSLLLLYEKLPWLTPVCPLLGSKVLYVLFATTATCGLHPLPLTNERTFRVSWSDILRLEELFLVVTVTSSPTLPPHTNTNNTHTLASSLVLRYMRVNALVGWLRSWAAATRSLPSSWRVDARTSTLGYVMFAGGTG